MTKIPNRLFKNRLFVATAVTSLIWQSLLMPITTIYATTLDPEMTELVGTEISNEESVVEEESVIPTDQTNTTESSDYTLEDDELWLDDVYALENMDGMTTFRANGYVQEVKRLGQTSYDLTHIVKGWKTQRGIPKLQATLGGITYDVFCIEPGLVHESGGYMNSQDYYNQLSNYQKHQLNLILMYGFRNNGNTSDDSYVATQAALWEVVTNQPTYGDVWKALINGNATRQSIYDTIMRHVRNHDVKASFTGQEHELKWNNNQYETTLTDTNKVLGYYEVRHPNNTSIHITKGNDQLHLISKTPNLKYSLELVKEAKYGGQTLFWVGSKQNLISGGQSTPVKSNVSVKTASLGSLTIEKKGPHGESIENVEFRVQGPNYNKTHKTNNQGIITLSNLMEGSYTVTEVSVPAPYLLDTTPKTVNLHQGKTASVQFTNQYAKGRVDIYKTGEQLSSVQQVNGGYSFKYTQQPLKDTTFDLYAKENIYRPDGKLLYSKDNLVTRLTTGADGRASANDLPLGKYYLREVQAPSGLVVSTKTYDITLTYKNASTSLVTTSHSFENFRQKVNLSLTKVGEKRAIELIPLANVSFGVYTVNDILIDGKVVIPKESLVHTLVTKTDGTVAESIALPIGSYYVQEIKAPEGYVISEEKFPFEFKGTSQQALSVDVNLNNGEVITNLLARGHIQLLKESSTNKPLANAVFDLYTKEGVLIGTYTSNENGLIEVKDLVYNDYYLMEQKAPSGYRLSNEKIPFAIRQNGETIKLTAVNQPTRVEITKLDPEKQPLEGATLQIIDEQDQVVAEWTTTKEAKVIEGLKHGRYRLRETKAPSRYQKVEDMTFEVTDANETITLSCVDKLTQVDIVKKDEIGNLLPGATLQLLQADGTLIEEWVSEESPKTFMGLAHGDYIVRETKAPNHFVKTQDITFTVSDNIETQTITMVDTLTKVEVHKVDATQTPLAGATLQLIQVAGENNMTVGGMAEHLEFPYLNPDNPNELILAEWFTDGTPRTFEGLDHGQYLIREVQQPLGYQKAADVKFEVTDALEIVKVEVVNTLTQTQITKYDNQGNKLFGATMQIIDAQGNIVVEWQTTDETKTIEGLVAGDYILREITAPDTFKKILDVPFKVTDEEKVHILEVTDEPTSTTIHKVDTNGKYLYGAVLQLIDSDGKVIEEWQSNKEPKTFKGLKHGDYILREIKAPRGYLVAADIKFAVTDSHDDLNITMVDAVNPNVESLPVTGVGWLVIGCFGGGFGLGGYGLYDMIKKRRRDE